MRALPIGPMLDAKVADGKLYRAPSTLLDSASWFADGEPIGYADETGSWQIGQYADGTWFRRRML